MTKQQLLSKQAAECKEVSDVILDNVSERRWKKNELSTHLDCLYMMGTRHGWEAANEYIAGKTPRGDPPRA